MAGCFITNGYALVCLKPDTVPISNDIHQGIEWLLQRHRYMKTVYDQTKNVHVLATFVYAVNRDYF